MKMDRRDFLAVAAAAATATPAAAASYSLETGSSGKTLKTGEGKEVFTYLTSKPPQTKLAGNNVCCFHPLRTPSGEVTTDFAPSDHPDHRGLFLAWHTMEFRRPANFSTMGPSKPTHGFDILRGDFWGWGNYAPTDGRLIVNRDLRLTKGDATSAVVDIHNDWMIARDKVLDEATTVSVHEAPGAYVLDFVIRLTSTFEVTIPQISFSGFCFRNRNDGKFTYAGPKGPATYTDPHYSVTDLNWPAADWYSYTLNSTTGKTIANVVMDHPLNPPTTWHNPRYLWMINPCIATKQAIDVPAGKPLTLRYRVVVHDGALPPGYAEKLSAEWKASRA